MICQRYLNRLRGYRSGELSNGAKRCIAGSRKREAERICGLHRVGGRRQWSALI